jgi:ketosteroid isomerase-like protein
MSRDAFRARLQQLASTLSTLEFMTHGVFETKQGVAARWTFTATTKGGRSATCDGSDSWRISDDGTITSVDVYDDPSPLVEALAD